MRAFLTILSIVLLTNYEQAMACSSPCGSPERPWWRFLIYPIVVAVCVYLWRWWFIPPAGVAFDPDDPDKLAAEQEAQQTLPIFWKAFDNPAKDETDFAVKFNLTPLKTAEFIWAHALKKENGKIYGMLTNEPYEPGYEPETYYEIKPELIVDWTYFQGNVAKGHFITKVMLRKMPKRFVKKTMKEFGWLSM
jgi:uncharacterized protein YegJ (DUF2314 family)